MTPIKRLKGKKRRAPHPRPLAPPRPHLDVRACSTSPALLPAAQMMKMWPNLRSKRAFQSASSCIAGRQTQRALQGVSAGGRQRAGGLQPAFRGRCAESRCQIQEKGFPHTTQWRGRQGRACSVSCDADAAAAACSPRLIAAKAPYFLRRPSRSPILGWAAKASSHPATGVCRPGMRACVGGRRAAAGRRRRGPGRARREAFLRTDLVPPHGTRDVDEVVDVAVRALIRQRRGQGGAGAALQHRGRRHDQGARHPAGGPEPRRNRELTTLNLLRCNRAPRCWWAILWGGQGFGQPSTSTRCDPRTVAATRCQVHSLLIEFRGCFLL